MLSGACPLGIAARCLMLVCLEGRQDHGKTSRG